MRTSELLIYVVVLLVVLVFNFLRPLLAERLRRMQRRQQEVGYEAGQEPERAAPPSAEEEVWEESWGRSRQTAPHAIAERTEAELAAPRLGDAPAVARPSGHGVAGALFSSRKDLRHAIVVMTVLGPCRALDPHDGA